jgi:hypothetical protein
MPEAPKETEEAPASPAVAAPAAPPRAEPTAAPAPPEPATVRLAASSFEEGRASLALLLEELRRGAEPQGPATAEPPAGSEVLGSVALTLPGERLGQLASRLGQTTSAAASDSVHVRVVVVRPPSR